MPARPLSTVLKCFHMLETIAEQPGPVRISGLGALLGESRATTYQRLLTLSEAGWLERLPDGSYRLSMRACRIANAALEQAGLGERARPLLNDLTARTGESCSLVMLEHNRIVIAQHVESPGRVRADPGIGAALSFRDSASGKIWLAYGPDDLARRLEEAGEAVAGRAELAAVRRQGFAVGGGGETLSGIAVIAAPVLDPLQRCAASLSLVVPEFRFDRERLLPPLRETAERIAALLRAQP